MIRRLLSPLMALLIAVGSPAASVRAIGPSVASCAAANITVDALHGPSLYIDSGSSPVLDSAYGGYRITNNTGSAIGDTWVRLDNFAGVVALDAGADKDYRLGGLASGGADSAFYYFVASAASASAQTHDLTVYDGNPDLGGNVICMTTGGFDSVEETIKAAANKVTGVSVDISSPSLGGTIQITVTGETGVIPDAKPASDPGAFWMSPSASADWASDAFDLRATSITISPDGVAAAQTYNDLLHFQGFSGPNREYTIVYTFTVVGVTAGSSSVLPVQQISSGTQIKHTDPSALGSIPAIAAASPTATVSKSAASATVPDEGGNMDYTVTLASSAAIGLDSIHDTMPVGASFVAGSATLDGSVVDDPYIVGRNLTFDGPFALDGTNDRELVYTLALPSKVDSGGITLTNAAYALIGTTQIDSTLSTSDDAKASVDVDYPSANSAPVCADTSLVTDVDVADLVTVSCTDPESDPLSYSIKTAPLHGEATIDPATGEVTYTPDPGYDGPDELVVEASDGSKSDTGTITITVNPAAPANSAPTCDDDTLVTDVDVADSLIASCSDPDGDPLSYSIKTIPTHGIVSIDPATGEITYTPDPGYDGPDELVIEVSDGSLTGTATITITVNPAAPANSAPTCDDVAETTLVNTAVLIGVDCSDPEEDSLAYTIKTIPNHGIVSISPSGVVNYTPDTDYTGDDELIVEASDGDKSATARVSITVLGEGEVCSDASISVSKDVVGGSGTITIDGECWLPGSTVIITLNGPAGQTIIVEAEVGEDGTFQRVITFNEAANGSWTATANGQAGDGGDAEDSLPLTVLDAPGTGGQENKLPGILLIGVVFAALALAQRRLPEID